MQDTATPAAFNLDLASVLDTTEKTVTVNFKGIRFEVRYVSKSELQKLGQKCSELVYDRAAGGRVEKMNSDKFAAAFVKAVIKGWEGATPEALAAIMPIDLTKIPETDRKREIAFSHQQVTVLLKNSYDLDQFLNNICTDISAFQPADMEEQVKNSEASQSGS